VRGTRAFTATATDAFGNPVRGTFVWRVLPTGFGTIAARPGGAAVFTAARRLGTGRVLATATGPGGQTSSIPVTVVPAKLRASFLLERRARGIRVTVQARDGARRPVSATRVRLDLERGGRRYSTVRATTGPAGAARTLARVSPGCSSVRIVTARAQGFVWDGRARARRICL
jgi:hypothetical protein